MGQDINISLGAPPLLDHVNLVFFHWTLFPVLVKLGCALVYNKQTIGGEKMQSDLKQQFLMALFRV